MMTCGWEDAKLEAVGAHIAPTPLAFHGCSISRVEGRLLALKFAGDGFQ